MILSARVLATTAALLGAVPVLADGDGPDTAIAISSGLVIPVFDAAEGRGLFASKGCVVCHSINGVGGEDAQPLDAEYMDLPMNPLQFAARMWAGAEAMIELQRDELGDVIYLEGEELAAIIAFVHDAEEQAKFTEADIPEEIKAMMAHGEDEEADDDHD